MQGLKSNSNSNNIWWTEKGMHITWGFAILGQDVVIFIISNMAAVVRAGQASVGFWLLSCTFVFQSAAVPGLTFFKSPNIAKPCSLAATHMQHRGHIIILRPDLDQKNFEALDHFQKHKADYEELREKFTFINPKNYRGTGRNHFDGNPFYVDNGILKIWPEAKLQTVDNLDARKLFATYENANTPQDTEDDLTFFSLEEIQNVYKLIDNKIDFEILEIIQNNEATTDKTIGFDVGYIGGDFFSAIADTAIKPMWHPPDFDDMNDIIEHLKKLNSNVLFDTFDDAENYRQTYLTKKWAEKEMYEGQITTIVTGNERCTVSAINDVQFR